jgi:hypothetical protein
MTNMTPQAKAAETRRRRREQEWQTYWETRIIPRTEGCIDWGMIPVKVQHGNRRAALDEAIQEVSDYMTMESTEDEQRLTDDVALYHQDRLLAVVQYSLRGPVVTRLELQVHS